MSPYEHGEVYVLEDGGEVDLDLGNYERFMNIHLTKDHNITTGKVYKQVLSNLAAQSVTLNHLFFWRHCGSFRLRVVLIISV